ncbi:hypothetical protein TNCV_1859291 [Trichonephila clavipes]|nr:hypothetical protein TNCV_1859291 [Trichonephila clavipes]
MEGTILYAIRVPQNSFRPAIINGEKELDRIVFRVKNKPVVPTPSKNQEAAKPAAVPSSSNSPRKGRKGKRSVDSDGFVQKKSIPVASCLAKPLNQLRYSEQSAGTATE